MPHMVVVDQRGRRSQGTEHRIEGRTDGKVMETLRELEFGGLCSCATCHLYIDSGWMERLPVTGSRSELSDECPCACATSTPGEIRVGDAALWLEELGPRTGRSAAARLARTLQATDQAAQKHLVEA
jgi:ferredoxin